MKKTIASLVGATTLCFLACLVMTGAVSAQETVDGKAPSVKIDLPSGTQGPLWPPSEVVNSDGDFIVIGNIIAENAPGAIFPAPGAALVSKDTVPPLDANGLEDFSNGFRNVTTPYTVIRPLDLSPGSPDLDLVLYTSSFGPPAGNFGAGPRIPALGVSQYNLNPFPPICGELFPGASQAFNYMRPSYPLHQAPIWGFQGDGIAYEPDTGAPFVPDSVTEPGCPPPGCPGENQLDFRRQEPITLGEFLEASGKLKITLTDFDETQNAYTAAEFDFKFRDLLPDGVYSIWTIRANNVSLTQTPGLPSPIAVPNVFVTDKKGKAKFKTKMVNPFPDPSVDTAGSRLLGAVVIWHSDYQNWGACFARFGTGVDEHIQLSSFYNTSFDAFGFTTVAPSVD